MTPPCVVPTFRPYTVENLEFGGFYASSCESRARLTNAVAVTATVFVSALNAVLLLGIVGLGIPLSGG